MSDPATNEELAEAREKLHEEFASVKENLGDVHVAFDAVRNAGPEDDISALLDDLEGAVKSARTGGLIGSGAKSHKRALDKYNEALAEAQ